MLSCAHDQNGRSRLNFTFIGILGVALPAILRTPDEKPAQQALADIGIERIVFAPTAAL